MVDSAFLDLVRDLMMRLGMEAKICDDVHPKNAHLFSLGDFAEFSALALGCIAVRRTEWSAAFGGEPMAATTNDVYREIILPRCQPPVTG
jgi:hypothetical protein